MPKNSPMPRVDNTTKFLPSVLDRLLDDRDAEELATNHDDKPDTQGKPEKKRAVLSDLNRMIEAVTRDLEALLNTRQELLQEPLPEFVEVRRSLLLYGLPDFTTLSILNRRDHVRIQRAVTQAIATFEPRLDRVRVTLEPPRQHEQTLRFRIEALLQVEPAPEHVIFDAMLQLSTQVYRVQGRD